MVIIEPNGSYEYIVYTGWQFGDNCQVIQTHSNLNHLFFQKLTLTEHCQQKIIKTNLKNMRCSVQEYFIVEKLKE